MAIFLTTFLSDLLLSVLLCPSRDSITLDAPLTCGDILVSSGRIFTFGVFTSGSGNLNHQYLGIWYKQIIQKTVVWVAN
jgi:hypothetical protein